MKKFIHILLNMYLGLFLTEATISFLDDSLILFNVHILSGSRILLGFFILLTSSLIYLLMGFTPMVPKRFFLPLVLFPLAAILGAAPLFIYHYSQIQYISWGISLCQILLILGLLAWLQRGIHFRMPFIRLGQISDQRFSWPNLSAFIAANVFLLVPAVLFYLAFCAALAVKHFSAEFLTLHPNRLAAHAKKYVRDDGKAIQLIPMMHIGQSSFYQNISKSFPTNSVILMEGVTDKKHRLKHKLSYKRAASVVGLSEQQENFIPQQGRILHADMDIDQFSKETIDFLNMVAFIHSKGLNAQTLAAFLQKSQDSKNIEDNILEDILYRRNDHLLKVILAEVEGTDLVIVPWGALHMSGIATKIQRSGFHPVETQEYSIIQFQKTHGNPVLPTKK